MEILKRLDKSNDFYHYFLFKDHSPISLANFETNPYTTISPHFEGQFDYYFNNGFLYFDHHLFSLLFLTKQMPPQSG